ncbi:hypothetical protein GCM10010358_21960 [Streptomyces minutiscleroticus]|uniref:LysR substrate-binding domain-containing protein n=1 Tax=Streptomyces minutiscleroticus TaxID=68238 RepID=A0A918NH11_9ACTN|nr:hypothetical protein GCM10010358_21960 [Streptomyces minutiscleroticus]
MLDRACAAQGLEPSIALQASAADAIADLAARGLGVAVLSASMAEGHRDRLTTLTVEDIITPALLALVWKSAHSPSVRELLVHSRRAFTDPASARDQPFGICPAARGGDGDRGRRGGRRGGCAARGRAARVRRQRALGRTAVHRPWAAP